MIPVDDLKVVDLKTEFSVDAKKILGDQRRRFIRAWATLEFNGRSIRVCSDTPTNATADQILGLMGLSKNLKALYHEDCVTLFMWIQELKEDMVEAIKTSEVPSDSMIKKLREEKHERARQKRIRDVRNAQLNELSNIFVRFDFSIDEVTDLWRMAQVSKTMSS